MSRERGRKKNYSNRNHIVREIKRKNDPFQANFTSEFNVDNTASNSKGNDNITAEITNMIPGKEYPIE